MINCFKPVSNPIYITAAHLDENNFADYTLLYKDIANDTAYYLNNKYEYDMPEVGSYVWINSRPCKVLSTNNKNKFVVEYSDNTYKGLSGSRVRSFNEDVVGFVSGSMATHTLECICIK